MTISSELTIEDADECERPETGVQNLVGLYRLRLRGIVIPSLYILTMTIIYMGWEYSAERPLTAEYGLGYWLGIIGGSMMLLLLLYPLRKHARFMSRLGPVKYWFRMHMLFGVLGPVCVLFHSSFRLGSMNSNIALFCMLAVATSGLFGRYFYVRIHHGLYGRKASLAEIQEHAGQLDRALEKPLDAYPLLAGRIRNYESVAQNPPRNIFSSFGMLFSLGIRTWLTYASLWFSFANDLPSADRKTLLQHIGARMECIRKLSEFQFYSRLFSAWHVLHFPLFLMLIFSGCIHVVAVHMY
jgi:hypothetical protein